MLEVLQAVSCIKKNQSWKIKYTTKREDEGGKMERKREKSLTWFNGNSFFLEMHLLSSYKDRKSHWRCNIITSVLFLCASVAFLTRMLAFIHSAQHQANMILFFVSGWCFFFGRCRILNESVVYFLRFYGLYAEKNEERVEIPAMR